MFSFYVSSALLIASCIVIIASETQIDVFSKRVNNFGVDIYQMAAQSKSKNFIISPYSMAMALNLLLQATNGTTYEELKKSLNLNSDKSIVAHQSHEYIELIEKSAGQSDLMITNQIYIQKEFQLNANFQNVAVNKFHADVKSVDFRKENETIKLINNFVEKKTNGKIKKIITADKITPLTRIFLINSIYLNCTWAQPFPLRGTRRDEFYIIETETVDVEYMGMKKVFGILMCMNWMRKH